MLLTLLLGLCALSACGEAPDGLRSSQRLATLELAATDRTVVDLTPAAGDVLSLPGQLNFGHDFDSQPGQHYIVSLRYRRAPGGLGPTIFAGAAGGAELARVGALAGGRAEGRLEVEWEALSTRSRVEARLPRGPPQGRGGPDAAQVLRLTVAVRPDPYGRDRPKASVDGVRELELYRDVRPGWVLANGQALVLAQALPEGATRVTLSMAAARHVQAQPEPSPELELVLRAVRHDGRSLDLERVSLAWSVPLWQDVDVDLRGHALGPGARLHLAVESPAGLPGGALALTVPVAHVEQGRRRPNLIVVSIDTLRRDRMGAYGYGRPTTPHLDALAERSLVFGDAVAAAPYTLPSHATMLSGQYPGRHGAQNPAHALHPGRTPLLAERLAAAGWDTRGATGGGYLDADYGFARGFSIYGQIDPVSGAGAASDSELAQRLIAAQDWSSALAWIEARQELPFFLFLQTFAVHDYQPPAAWRARFAREGAVRVTPLRRAVDQRVQPYSEAELAALGDLYDAGLAWVDDHVGDLLQHLDALDLTRHTILVITSDHGEAFGERGLNGHGHSLHAEQLQVPLLLSGPGLPARRIDRRVSLVDLTPTLLDLLGVLNDEVAQDIDGRSLRPLWEHTPPGWQPSPVLAELDSNVSRSRALYDGPAKLIVADTGAAVELPALRARELYDVVRDPAERRDLLATGDARAAEAQALAVRLRDLFDALQAKAAGTLVPAALDDDTRQRLIELGYLDVEGGR